MNRNRHLKKGRNLTLNEANLPKWKERRIRNIHKKRVRKDEVASYIAAIIIFLIVTIGALIGIAL